MRPRAERRVPKLSARQIWTVAAAAALLRGGYAKILDIALDLGYSDHAHFTRAFHRWAGTAPREFRRLARQSA